MRRCIPIDHQPGGMLRMRIRCISPPGRMTPRYLSSSMAGNLPEGIAVEEIQS